MPTTLRIPLGRAHLLASLAIRDARRAGLTADFFTPLGSLRRYAPDVGDVSLLGIAPIDRHPQLLEGFSKMRMVNGILATTSTRVEVATERGPIALHVVSPDHAGAALLWHTGSRRHVEQLQARAAQFGLSLRNGRLSRKGGPTLPIATEEELYRYLGLAFIPPELREGQGEIEAAERGALPQLLAERHIRGDLHMHSTWSDGRDSIEQMVLAARQLGYEYAAITDHSERSWASRKLAGSDIEAQRKEVESLRERVRGIELLHGVEVDIMHDGSLDFDDAQLEGFDIVLASLHDHGGHDGAWLTERYLRAIRHPLVNIITHPANRTPALSSGYELDYDRLFSAAAETGTAMEVDGSPGHLDLDGTLAKRAVAAGVTLVVDSDSHRADALGRQMQFGVGTARRGWVTAAHVLNTKPLEAVRAFVAHKRARR